MKKSIKEIETEKLLKTISILEEQRKIIGKISCLLGYISTYYDKYTGIVPLPSHKFIHDIFRDAIIYNTFHLFDYYEPTVECAYEGCPKKSKRSKRKIQFSFRDIIRLNDIRKENLLDPLVELEKKIHKLNIKQIRHKHISHKDFNRPSISLNWRDYRDIFNEIVSFYKKMELEYRKVNLDLEFVDVDLKYILDSMSNNDHFHSMFHK
jgi:hypothetical protein